MSSKSGLCNVAQKEFVRQLADMGLKIREVQGDGNCLFRALSDQMEGNSDNHLHYRHETAKYMMSHRRDFESFLEDDCTFEEYVCSLQREGTYSGNDSIVAFARRFDVNVIIHQVCAPLWIIEGGCCHAPELHIAYYNGDHYSSIRRFGDDSIKPAKIWLRDLKKYRKERRKRKPLDSEIRRMVQHIMNVTECADPDMVEQLLDENNFDVDQTIVKMTENGPCSKEMAKELRDCPPPHLSDDDRARQERYARKNAKKNVDGCGYRNQQRNNYDCNVTEPEECGVLSEAAQKQACYDRGRSPRKGIMQAPSRTQSKSSSGKSSTKALSSRLSDDSEGPPLYGRSSGTTDDVAVLAYKESPPRALLNDDAPLPGTYSDTSSVVGREAPQFKERGESASRMTPPSPKASVKSSHSRSPRHSKSPRVSKSPRRSNSPRTRNRASPKARRTPSASPRVSRKKFSKEEFCRYPGDQMNTRNVASRSIIDDEPCEDLECPLVERSSSCRGSPPCPPASDRSSIKSVLPIVCKTLSDAVLSTASSTTSQDHIDKTNCALRSRARASDTWLNVMLGLMVAFLVFCLIKLF